MAKTFYVNCPHCDGLMEIDATDGHIIQKWAPGEKSDSSTDKMSAALKKISDGKKRRENLFSQTKEQLEGDKKKVQNTFQQEVDRIKKEGIKENPLTPFDLD